MSYKKATAGFDALARAGIGVSEAAILLVIAQNGGLPFTVSGLARAVKSPMSTVSRQAWALRELGFLKYNQARTDRRVVEITITNKGADLLAPFLEGA